MERERIAMKLDTIVRTRNLQLPDLVQIDVHGAIIEGGLNGINNAKHLIVEMQHIDFNLNASKVDETLPYIESLEFKCTAPAFSATQWDADYGFVCIDVEANV